MKRTVLMGTLTAAVFATACSDAPTDQAIDLDELAAAFESAPLAYSSAQSSFAADADSLGRHGPDGFGFGPGGPGMRGRGGPGRGHGRPPHLGAGFGQGGRGLMGGLAPEFHGAVDGRGPGRGPFSARNTEGCTFDAATGRLACAPETRDGITIARSLALTTAGGVAQATFDSLTTNSVNTRITVSGTSTRGSVSRTVSHTSDRTVSGLAVGSTSRTVNGTSAGTETSTGTFRDTAFTAVRVAGDTTSGLVIPLATGTHPYPTAGTIIRRMTVTLTRDGQAAQTSTRREVITYDGSATARLVITRDGETKTCTIALPHGRPACE